jgi:hypothetical protein
VGITNNSGITQHFVLFGRVEETQMRFTNRASAGNASILIAGNGSSVHFFNRSTAGSATMLSDGGEASYSFSTPPLPVVRSSTSNLLELATS